MHKFPACPLRHYNSKEEEDIYNYPKFFANYILTISSKSYKGHIKILGEQILFLTHSLGYDNLIFLGDSDIPWLKRSDTQNNFQNALQYLVENKIGKRFNGALQVDKEEIPTFIKNLAWLVRTNGILSYIYFIDPEQNFIANVCQYGNLHISTMNKLADKKIKKIILNSQFIYLAEANCSNKFSKDGRIKERSITV
jgi:hypothetical protein